MISQKTLVFTCIVVVILSTSIILFFLFTERITKKEDELIHMNYHTNILTETKNNTDYRRVLFTGTKSQLVVMSIPPGGDIGTETHIYTEQTLFFLSGTGTAILNDERFPVGPGDVFVITPGTKHEFINTGTEDLKIYTVYTPPNHIDGRIHKTKADADRDVADEAVGKTPPVK